MLRLSPARVGLAIIASAVGKKHFTLEEARQLLPLIRPAVARAMDLRKDMTRRRDEVKQLAENAANNSGSPTGTVYVERLLALRACVEQIRSSGCLLKSVQEGLVDFPHLKDGREVYLCWRYGEDDIEYWHEVEAGFAGRKPISE